MRMGEGRNAQNLPSRRSVMAGMAAAIGAPSATSSVMAQSATLPPGAFTIIIPTAAGGQADAIARIIGNKLSAILNRPLLVEAKAGAGGLFAGQHVARAEPNGATLLLVTGAHSILPGIHRKTITFDAVKDFAFISTISVAPFIVSVGPSHPAKSFSELIALSKAQEGTVSYATVGVGSTHHLIGELIQATFDVKWTHVPYRGGSTGLMDVARNRVSVAIDTPASSLALVQSGELRALAVSQEPRMKQLPEVPTISEQSPGFNVGTYLGLAAPAKTPKGVVDIYNRAMLAALEDNTVQERLTTLGNTPQSSTPEAFRSRVEGDVERWTKLIENLGI